MSFEATARSTAGTAALLVWLALSGALRADDPAWLTEARRRLDAPGQAATAYDHLSGQPLAVKKTADYQWALAQVHRALDQPEKAAMALVTYDILTRRKGRDVSDLRSWLGIRALKLLDQAVERLRRGDEPGACRLYLHAAICDQALIRQPAEGLRDSTGTMLARLAHGHPEKLEFWVLLAGYHYHMHHLEASRAAMIHYLSQNLDGYQRWRGEVWLSSIDRRIEKDRAVVDKLVAEAQAEQPGTSAEPPPPEPGPALEVRQRDDRLARQRRLIDLDARIRNLEIRIRELQERRRGRVVVSAGGRVGVIAYNQREVKAELAAAEKQLEELKAERDSLE